jgi:hypothetical protein
MLESVGPLRYVIRKLTQVRESGDTSQSRLEVIEIIEALILALVAVATAWSGYQAAKWAGNRAELYAKANRLRVSAEGLATRRPGANLRQRHLQQLARCQARWQNPGGGVLRAALPRRVSTCIRSLDEDGSIQQPSSASGPDLHARLPQRQARAVSRFDETSCRNG